MTRRKHAVAPACLAGALLVAGLLAGCGSSNQELQEWTEQQKREIKPNVPPLAPPKKFDPEPYSGGDGIDPFSSQKLAVLKEAKQTNALLAAELNRRKEPLEAYPLDNMVMVGSVVQGGQRQALLKVDNLLYHVKVGDHLGQNYGRITKIDETEITIREIVEDPTGTESIERTTSLQLEEKAR